MSIVCFGEMLLRLSPASIGGLQDADSLALHVAGAEANVAISLAALGNTARMATVLPDNPLGDRAAMALRHHGVDTDACLRRPGRMGLYFVESPRAGREGGFFYDRANSAFTDGAARIDWDTALAGARWLHLSGISAALGDGPVTAMREAISRAREHGVAVSFDCNFRPLLWTGREIEAAQLMTEFANSASLIFASEADVRLMLGPNASAADLLAAMPSIRWIAATTRASGERPERLGATLTTPDGAHTIAPTPIEPYVDRLGAGDAFAAGLLHALANGWDDADALRFAHRACHAKHAISGDFSTLSESDILDTR